MVSLNFAWWNLGNFFDIDDDPISDDLDFTPEHGWTQPVFEAKRDNLAAGLRSIFDGDAIDLLAVCEIEKDPMLLDIAQRAGMPLAIAEDHTFYSSDKRGIDVAIAYNPQKLRVEKTTSHVIYLRYPTRDLFEVEFTVLETGEPLVVIASHWPSRRLGRYDSEPSRITVAENLAYLVARQLKVTPAAYESLRGINDLHTIQKIWDKKVMIVGDFNDEPFDRSCVSHLNAAGDLDRVIGETNDIDKFKDTGAYRTQPIYLFNAMWKFLSEGDTGSFFYGETGISNRFQILDQIVTTRGLLQGSGLKLDRDSVQIVRNALLATESGRPRPFRRVKGEYNLKGYSDHLPVRAVLRSD
jgi:hypothetical protein